MSDEKQHQAAADKPAAKPEKSAEAKASAAKPEGKTPSKPQSKPKAKPKGEAKGSATGPLAVLLALIALAAAGYLWQQQQLLLQQVEGMTGQLGQLDESLEQRQRQYQRQLDELAGRQRQQFAQLSQAQAQQPQQWERLEQQLQQLRSHLPEQLREWELAEVDYLLQLADQHLQLARDPGAASQALRRAQHTLDALDEPALAPLAQAIDDDLARIAALQPVDHNALRQRLDALDNEVSGLALKPWGRALKSEAETAQNSTAQHEGNAWQRFWQRLRGDLSALVVIRHHDEPWRAAVSTEQQRQLQNVLLLRLEAARLALQAQSQPQWQSTLAAAQQWLTQHFDPQQPAWQRLDAELQVLAEVSLRPDYPNVQPSIELLERLRDQRPEAALEHGAVITPEEPSPQEAARPSADSDADSPAEADSLMVPLHPLSGSSLREEAGDSEGHSQ